MEYKSLKTEDEILDSPEYVNNSDFLENYLKNCEEEYKNQLYKKHKIEKYMDSLNENNLTIKKSNTTIINNIYPEALCEYQSNKIDTSKYLEEVMLAEDMEELEIVLPEKSSSTFYKVTNMLILELLKEINETNYLLHENQDENLILELQEHKKLLEEKVELLINYRDLEQKIIEEKEAANIKPIHLIFATNEVNNVLFTRDLKAENIPFELYSDILKEVQKLKLNQEKKWRYIDAIECDELRKNDIRIFYKKYETETAIFNFIIGIFYKKCYSNSYYYSYISNRAIDFKKYYKSVVPKLYEENVEQFIDFHNAVLEDIINRLQEGSSYVRTYK